MCVQSDNIISGITYSSDEPIAKERHAISNAPPPALQDNYLHLAMDVPDGAHCAMPA
jgi:hypothetical protein